MIEYQDLAGETIKHRLLRGDTLTISDSVGKPNHLRMDILKDGTVHLTQLSPFLSMDKADLQHWAKTT